MKYRQYQGNTLLYNKVFIKIERFCKSLKLYKVQFKLINSLRKMQ